MTNLPALGDSPLFLQQSIEPGPMVPAATVRPPSCRWRWFGLAAAIVSLSTPSRAAVTEFTGSEFAINDNTTATPYPSTITVSGVSGTVQPCG